MNSISRHALEIFVSLLLMMSAPGAYVFAAAPATAIFFSDYGSGTIGRIAPDGSGGAPIVSGVSPRGLAVDSQRRKLYWLSADARGIHRADLDGSNANLVLTTAGIPYDVELDLVNGKIYWTDYAGGAVGLRRANLDGTAIETLMVTGLSVPAGLALDVPAAKVYFADYGAGTVLRANLDGSGRETLLSGRPNPNHVALDLARGHLYWTEALHSGRVMRANLDGTGIMTLVNGEASPAGLVLDLGAGKMYWAREDGHAIGRANLDGTAVETFLGGLGRPLSFALLVPASLGTYDLTADFSASQNPNGVWSYGWAASRGATFQLATATGQASSYGSLIGWIPYEGIISPAYAVTDWDAPGEFVPAGTLNLHPGPLGQNSVIRWTAPSAGTYAIQGWFEGNNFAGPTSTNVAILRGTAEIFSGVINGFDVPVSFSLVVQLNAGEAVDFAVGDGGNGSFADATGISATVSRQTIVQNQPPSITAVQGLSLVAGTYGSSTIATVSDPEDPAGTLIVTAVNVPSGITITNITNTGGTVTATRAASCTAASGANIVTLRVTDSAGATSTSNLLLQVWPSTVSATITATGPTTFCTGGSVMLSANSGASYLWSNGVTTQSIVVSSGGSYSVVVTDAHGCSATSEPVTVTVNPRPPAPAIVTAMSSGTATLTASNIAGAAYTWTLDGASFGTGNPITTTVSGSYAVTASYPSGCSATSAPSSVIITNSNQPSTTLNGVTISTSSFPSGTMLSVDASSNPNSIPPAPMGYYNLTDSSGNLILAYEIKATSSPTGKIELAFDVPPSLAPDWKALQSLRILHGEYDKDNKFVLVDSTLRHDFDDSPVVRRVIASVKSLSPFVLAQVRWATIDAIAAPAEPVQINSTVSVSATFTDPDAGDIHTAIWEWGDGSTSAGAIVESGGSGTATASHTYASAGVYTVRLTVSDNTTAGGSSSVLHEYVVVYDPDGGFVTGGGTIDSPAGAYVADATLTGKATFGFVSKYQKGANVPTGKTQFQFHVASFNFHSTAYEWLVVAGAKAQYKGSGTVNGSGDYGFLLTATDGQVNGGAGVDKFRIKIWNRATGAVAYDNVFEGGDDLEGAQPQAIASGSITVHSK